MRLLRGKVLRKPSQTVIPCAALVSPSASSSCLNNSSSPGKLECSIRSPSSSVWQCFFTLGSRERLEIRDSFELEPTAQTVRKIRWPRRTIQVSLSNSLLSPGASIKPDSDVVGAARRALSRWANLSNITFVVTWSSATSISPADAGDGISLITIASTPENDAFNSEVTTGRTRVFFDPETGNIA